MPSLTLIRAYCSSPGCTMISEIVTAILYFFGGLLVLILIASVINSFTVLLTRIGLVIQTELEEMKGRRKAA